MRVHHHFRPTLREIMSTSRQDEVPSVKTRSFRMAGDCYQGDASPSLHATPLPDALRQRNNTTLEKIGARVCGSSLFLFT